MIHVGAIVEGFLLDMMEMFDSWVNRSPVRQLVHLLSIPVFV